jgi:hypothetical protein
VPVPVPVATPAPSIAASKVPGNGPKPGFRDLRWGDGLIPGLSHLEDRGSGEVVYKRPADAMTIGPVPLESIAYVYFSERLRGVEIRVAAGEVPSLVTALESAWGPREQTTDGERPVSKWYAANSGIDDTVALLFHRSNDTNLLQICNDRAYQERHDQRNSRPKK